MFLATTVAEAGGINRISGLGTRAFSLGGAYTAIADDGSACYYNVAGLDRTEKNLFQFEAELLAPKFSFDGGGKSFRSENTVFPLPTLSLHHRISDESVLGVSLYTPYGMGGTYPDSRWRKSLVSLTNLTIAKSYRVNDRLVIGAGIDFGCGQLIYSSAFHQLGDVIIDPLFVENKGMGFGVGGRLGLLWQATDNLTVGISYSSPMRVKLKGETDLNLFNLKFMEDKFKSSFTFPQKFGLGFAWQATPKTRWSADVYQYDYSRSQKLTFDFKTLPNISQQLKWQSMWAWHLGVEHKLNERWVARAGIGWQDEVIPESTTNPITIDAPGYVYTVGLGYVKNDWSLDAGYGFVDASRRAEGNVLAPGNYRAVIHALLFSVGYKF